MVKNQLQARGVADPRVLAVMGTLPRHLFVAPELAARAYADHPLPIGHGQTISQPYIVAFMAEALQLQGTEQVLEVGSGCGYMAAVLAHLARAVFGLELEPALHRQSRQLLEGLGLPNLTLRCGDGRLGWPEAAPFDAILVSCATEAIPPGLWDQLAVPGRLLLPLVTQGACQELVLVRKTLDGAVTTRLLPVVFVPLR